MPTRQKLMWQRNQRGERRKKNPRNSVFGTTLFRRGDQGDPAVALEPSPPASPRRRARNLPTRCRRLPELVAVTPLQPLVGASHPWTRLEAVRGLRAARPQATTGPRAAVSRGEDPTPPLPGRGTRAAGHRSRRLPRRGLPRRGWVSHPWAAASRGEDPAARPDSAADV